MGCMGLRLHPLSPHPQPLRQRKACIRQHPAAQHRRPKSRISSATSITAMASVPISQMEMKTTTRCQRRRRRARLSRTRARLSHTSRGCPAQYGTASGPVQHDPAETKNDCGRHERCGGLSPVKGKAKKMSEGEKGLCPGALLVYRIE